MKFGIKIWSINHEAFDQLADLYARGMIDYVELYTYPESFDKKNLSKLISIPVIFHAPTFFHGMNLGEDFVQAEKLVKDIRQYKNLFNSEKIIFHPGVVVDTRGKACKNSIKNILILKEEFDLILENVPAVSIDNKWDMLFSSPSEFQYAVSETKVKTCLDFGHAITSANHAKEKPFGYIRQFLSLDPYMFHLSDGDYDSHIDMHLDFNQGSFPLEKIAALFPVDARLSLETPKKDFKTLSEDLSNLSIIKAIVSDSGLHKE